MMRFIKNNHKEGDMKKSLFVAVLAVALLASGAAFAGTYEKFGGALKIGVDFAGEWEVENSTSVDFDTDTGVSIGGEGYYRVNPYFDAGIGIQYLFEREIDTSGGAEFWFLPLYAVARVHPEMTDHTPYGILQIGYSFHDGNDVYSSGADLDGGFYWGAGAGYIFKRHFLAEILYSESRGDENISGLDITHRRVTLSVGYNF